MSEWGWLQHIGMCLGDTGDNNTSSMWRLISKPCQGWCMWPQHRPCKKYLMQWGTVDLLLINWYSWDDVTQIQPPGFIRNKSVEAYCFLCVTVYDFLVSVGIVSRLLTPQQPGWETTIQLFSPGLVMTGHQRLGFVVIALLFWCQATFHTAFSSFLPYHSVFCRIPGRLVGLVLPLVFLQGMTCISCCTAPFPPSVNHLRCGSRWSIPPQHSL